MSLPHLVRQKGADDGIQGHFAQRRQKTAVRFRGLGFRV